MPALIEAEELAGLLNSSTLCILDASWHMPASGRNARAECKKTHIPGAQFFDIDAISDTSSPYPHMLPSAEAFESAASALGICNDSDIVVYDSLGLFSAARAWWMFRVFGHERVRVLNGGLPRWQSLGLPLSYTVALVSPASFHARFQPHLYRTHEQIINALNTEQIIDARSPARFLGEEPEPRPGLRSGHIPGSINIHYKECLNEDGRLKSMDELRTLFQGKLENAAKPLTASCGSGVTACILALAQHTLGNTDVPVYDGSWAQWGTH